MSQPSYSRLRSTTLHFVLGACLALPQVGQATVLELSNIWLVGRRAHEPVATPGNRISTPEAPITLYVVVEGRAPGRLPTYFSEAPILDLGWGVIPASQVRPWDLKLDGPVQLDWKILEPVSQSYDNLSPQFHLAPIEYTGVLIERAAGSWSWQAQVHPTLMPDPAPEVPTGLGIARVQVRLKHQKVVLATPGQEGRFEGGLPDDIPWVAYRGADASPMVSWTQALFNTPWVAGASRRGRGEESHQAYQGVGTDSIELLAAAYRHAGHLEVGHIGPFLLDPTHEANMTRQIARARPEGEGYIDPGGEPVRIGPDGLMPGDLLRSGEQAGVYIADRPPLGLLDANDQVLTALFREPRRVSLGESLHGPLTLLRWNDAREAQLDLKLLGFYAGEPDGRVSTELYAAVDVARTKAGLEPVGNEKLQELLHGRGGYDQALPPTAVLSLLRTRGISGKLSGIERRALLQRTFARAARCVGGTGELAMTFEPPRKLLPAESLVRKPEQPFAPWELSFWATDTKLETAAQALLIGDMDRDGRLDISGQPVPITAPGPSLVLWTETDGSSRNASSSARRYGNQVWIYVPRFDVVVGYLHLGEVAVKAGQVLDASTELGTIGRTGSLAAGKRTPTALRTLAFATGEGLLTPVDTAGLWRQARGPRPSPWLDFTSSRQESASR